MSCFTVGVTAAATGGCALTEFIEKVRGDKYLILPGVCRVKTLDADKDHCKAYNLKRFFKHIKGSFAVVDSMKSAGRSFSIFIDITCKFKKSLTSLNLLVTLA